MNINNEQYSVPSAVWNVFQSYIPFGSDYVAYCSRYSSSSREFVLLYRKIGSEDFSRVIATYNYGGSYNFVEDTASADDVVVAYPYYAYSNFKGQGQYTTLPSTDSLMCLMLVICACLLILRTVFGGIKLWGSRKRYSVY